MEQEKNYYQSPNTIVVSLGTATHILETSNNGEMHNGGFLGE